MCFTVLVTSGCNKKYEAPVPSAIWPLYDYNHATELGKTSRGFMEGVYAVTEGTDKFGEQVVLKWSYVSSITDTVYYLSVFCNKDIGYFICEGKNLNGSLIFKGYWRKITNVQTGQAHFIIGPEKGGNQLLSSSPQIGAGSIVLQGTWGTSDETPVNPVTLTYVRPLYSGKPLEIVGHHGGGLTSDHLPYSENSIGMIRFASRLGATAVQLDVRQTSDEILVVYKDNTLNQGLVQKSGLAGGVENFTYEQITTFVKLIDGENIPTLQGALDAIIYTTHIRYVWLDTRNIESLNSVRELQKSYTQKAIDVGRDVQIVIGLADEDKVAAYLQLPDYQSAPALCELGLEDVQSTNAAVWAPQWTDGTQDAEVGQVQGAGRKAFVWTLNDPDHLNDFVNESHFDGILSDYPSLVAYYYYVKQ
jgi:glycerophosphoryl diester phosphodiesterase